MLERIINPPLLLLFRFLLLFLSFFLSIIFRFLFSLSVSLSCLVLFPFCSPSLLVLFSFLLFSFPVHSLSLAPSCCFSLSPFLFPTSLLQPHSQRSANVGLPLEQQRCERYSSKQFGFEHRSLMQQLVLQQAFDVFLPPFPIKLGC